MEITAFGPRVSVTKGAVVLFRGAEGRAALALVALFCTCCAATPELLRARDAGAKTLGCDGQQAKATLQKETGAWRVYDVQCEQKAVRVACSEEQSCQLEGTLPSAHGG